MPVYKGIENRQRTMSEKCDKNKTSKTIQEKDKNREKIEKFEANRSDKNEGENVPCHEIQLDRQPWRKPIRPPVVAESNETTGRGGIH